MSDNYYNTSTSFEPAPTGNHGAILVKIVDIGTQTGEYKGEKTVRRQEIWTWEIPLELMEDGQPFIISKFYTSSLGEKSNLYKDLNNWFGKPPKADLDPETLLGKACQVSVVEREGTGKRVVGNVSGLAKGIELPKKPHNPLVFFSLRPGRFNQDIFDNLSSGIQNMIMKSPEYMAIVDGPEPEVTSDADDEDPPF